MATQVSFEVGQRIQSRSGVYYRNIQTLGAGGNSVVFLVIAQNKEHGGALFALRIFTRLADTQRLTRFRREADFLRNCDHPAIMRIYDDGVYPIREGSVTSEYPFVVAEYLPDTLDRVLRGTTTSAERVTYTLQLLSALNYLSCKTPKVVHRDIKPANIFVKGRSCVLGDFGLMKLLEDDDEHDGEVLTESVGPGMPKYYRTPDLVAYAKRERQITPKSDVFQLGLVVAEMFTGRNPLKRVSNLLEPVELEALRTIPGALHAGIRAHISSMLIMDSDSRPSAAELIDPWDGTFREIVNQCHVLDGRVF